MSLNTTDIIPMDTKDEKPAEISRKPLVKGPFRSFTVNGLPTDQVKSMLQKCARRHMVDEMSWAAIELACFDPEPKGGPLLSNLASRCKLGCCFA